MARRPPDPALEELWRAVRGELEQSLPGPTFDLWLAPLRAVAVQGSTVYLTAPDPIRTWVQRRYAGQIEAALRRREPSLTDVALVGDDERPASVDGGGVERSRNPSHTFDRFVIGPGNRLAHAAALAVAELPGEAYNPLFLHGRPGLGKSHLLGAIADYMERNHRSLTVHHTTAELFTTEFVTALRRDGPERFKSRYRELDALLIDDVQVLEGKERTQEEFVHTFNALYAAGKQIVLSSDRPPEALSRLAERLRDRFRWGLCVELEPPDLRTRVALLWRFAADAGSKAVDPDVLREIAAQAPENVRVLEGTMTRAIAISSLLSEPLSLAVARRALRSGSKAPSQPPTVEAIQDAVCAVIGLTRTELVSRSRSARVVRGRQLAMYLARELTELSLADVARCFDRDHTTVLHATRSVASRLEPGSDEARAIHSVRLRLRGETDDGPAPLTDRASPPPPTHG